MKSNIKSDKVWLAQTRTLKMLESQLLSLENATRDLRRKVETDKLDAYYSENSDCVMYAVKVWKSCLRLAELKKLQWELEGRNSYGKIVEKGEEE